MSYVPRRTSTPMALCVSFSVAAIVDLLLFLEGAYLGARRRGATSRRGSMHVCRSGAVRGQRPPPRRARRGATDPSVSPPDQVIFSILRVPRRVGSARIDESPLYSRIS